ncbi:hypothetical protein [Solibacillus sp. FSL H8-0538]|uniref:hypothetical protein n=1 Tax=Solibacillus sp. FSL H8-0538 TaxID=2921400 RepID=UPI0030FCCC01
MFFSLTKQESKDVETKDLYEQLYTIVLTLLKQELPELNGRHHLLYTANVQLEQYRTNSQLHRKRANVHTAIGAFHKQAYDFSLKHFNQLQILIDSYIHLSVIEERNLFNHRLKMKDGLITLIYEELQQKKQLEFPPQLEEKFWHALKEDIFPVLAILEG